MVTRNFNNTVFTDKYTVLPFAASIEKEVPEVKRAVVTTYLQSGLLTYENSDLKRTGYTVSGDFFEMFSWKFLKGNAATAIREPNSIVLTASAAKALFGNMDAIGKIIRINDFESGTGSGENVKVTAILADLPSNSTSQFDYIRPFDYSDDLVKQYMDNWTASSWFVFVETNPGTDMQVVNKKIDDLKKRHDPVDQKISTFFTFPMPKWRLYSDFKDGKNVGGLITYVKLFTIVALVILLIACINFMNLTTARSEKRAKEVGVRKTLGSSKKQLILQFFSESMILTVIAFVFSILAVYPLLPFFNTLVEKQMSLDLSQPHFWIGALVIIVITGVVAGSYPALYLSSFNPVNVLKGIFAAGKKAVLPRQVLVAGQFVISILLISATIIVYQQIQHIKKRDLGYNAENLIVIPGSPDTQRNFEIIKQELLQAGVVKAITRTSYPITEVWSKSPAPEWEGKPDNLQILFANLNTDKSFTETMDVKIVEGKNFSGLPSDSSLMLLNKAAVEVMGLRNPVGKQIRFEGKAYQVAGITNNIIMESPFQPVDPMMVFFDPGKAPFISIRLNATAELRNVLGAVETIFKKYNPAVPFEYQFADQEFGKKFLREELISKLATIFAGLAIFICCMGLAGLASFTIEKRIREIGIRKVLGASVQQLLMLISKEFLKLVAIAFVIAVPLAWWLMYNWLQNYTFRVNISIWLFGAVGIIVLLLTLAVVSLNTIGVALANPVKNLRTE
jgi:ABC-type antimicrobial peptide transport system permease subunit